MPRPPIRVQQPEGEAERSVCVYLRHGCPQASALRKAVGDEDCDLIQFTVGLQGWGMPLDVPFVVTGTNSCDACGKSLQHWFVWGGRRVIQPKLWTPA